MRLVSVLALFMVVSAHGNDSDLEGSLRKHVENYYESFAQGSADKIDPKEFSRGFGFRTQSARTEISFIPDGVINWAGKKFIEYWLSTMDYYRGYIEEVHYAVDENVGTAWGFHIEEFKTEGEFPEKVRVRFSSTYLYSERTQTWRPLLSHRDIQEFNMDGDYISPDN